MKYFPCLLTFLFTSFAAIAQPDTLHWETAKPHSYAFINQKGNVISNPKALYPFFDKLYELRRDHKGTVSAVHIGDSHIQADMMTSHLRKGFQQYFGNAGRGIVFAWQLAKSNGPADVTSSSNVTWQYNRLSHPEISIQTGISGFGIHSNNQTAHVHMRLKPADSAEQYFNKLTFFTGGSDCYTLTSPGLRKPATKHAETAGTQPMEFMLDEPASEFELSRCDGERGNSTMSFYGVSMERTDTPGVIYHTIGVNGAQYDQYNNVALFREQQAFLKGSLFIVSMGTNEAQNLSFSTDTFFARCDTFLAHIRRINPEATLIITTPAGSYYKAKKPNSILPQVTATLIRFCKERNLAYWDLYAIGGGKAGTVQWKHNNLLAHDLVHYNAAGYTLQGQLLLSAISHAYNDYVLHRPKEVKKAGKTRKASDRSAKPTVKTADTVKKQPAENKKKEESEKPDTRKHIIKVTEDQN